jgi:inorganic pyrophosphatase
MKDGIIGNIVTVTVDRPKGSRHSVYKDLFYPINYGYIKGVMAPDGEEQDAYIIGVDKPVKKFTGKVVAIIHRKDDIEDKWVVCPENMTYTKSEIGSLVYFQEQYFDFEVIVASEEANRVLEDYSIALGEIQSYSPHRNHPVFAELQEAGRELRSGEEINYHIEWNIVDIDESHIYVTNKKNEHRYHISVMIPAALYVNVYRVREDGTEVNAFAEV